jgi:hypothetical protein
MLGFIVAVVLIALSVWGVSATVHGLRRTNAGATWWLIFTMLSLIGAGVGAWFAFRFEYRVSHDFRFAGFPVPVAFFHLESGDWVDFIIPPYFAYPGLFADIATFATVLLLPLLVTLRITERRRLK